MFWTMCHISRISLSHRGGSDISANLLLSRFEYITIMQEKGLHLIDTAWRNEDEVENSKKTEL